MTAKTNNCKCKCDGNHNDKNNHNDKSNGYGKSNYNGKSNYDKSCNATATQLPKTTITTTATLLHQS